jgi:uncharacterized protein YuzB (UPF0349 family)
MKTNIISSGAENENHYYGCVAMKIKYCCNNMKQGTKHMYSMIEEQHPDIKQKKKDCLGCCKMCKKQCVVEVGKNGYICADNAELLYMKLKQLLA